MGATDRLDPQSCGAEEKTIGEERGGSRRQSVSVCWLFAEIRGGFVPDAVFSKTCPLLHIRKSTCSKGSTTLTSRSHRITHMLRIHAQHEAAPETPHSRRGEQAFRRGRRKKATLDGKTRTHRHEPPAAMTRRIRGYKWGVYFTRRERRKTLLSQRKKEARGPGTDSSSKRTNKINALLSSRRLQTENP